MVEITINRICRMLMFPAVISVNMVVKFKNGIIAINGVVVIPIIKAIIPGNKDMNVNGVRALCASLNVFDVEAIAIHSPLIKNEYVIITTMA